MIPEKAYLVILALVAGERISELFLLHQDSATTEFSDFIAL
jgi:hypothetical protein